MSVKDIQDLETELGKLLPYSNGQKLAKKYAFAKYGLSPKRTQRLIDALFASWHKDNERSRKYTKLLAVRRIEGHIRDASTRGNMREVAALETQLAKIQGTEVPLAIKVDAVLGPIVGAVLSVMTPEAMAQMAAEFDRMQALAARVIDVPALPAAVTQTEDDPTKSNT